MEKIAIHEEKEAIKRTHEQAQSNVDLLNSIHRLKPFNDLQMVLGWSKDSGLVQKLFFEENPEAQKLASFTKQEFVFPPHLIQLQNLLRSVNNQTLTLTKFDSKKKIWLKDLEAIESYCDRYRRFAETPEQIARWNFANGYCDFINQIRPGTNGRKTFVNEIADLKAGGKEYVLSPRWQFALSDYKY